MTDIGFRTALQQLLAACSELVEKPTTPESLGLLAAARLRLAQGILDAPPERVREALDQRRFAPLMQVFLDFRRSEALSAALLLSEELPLAAGLKADVEGLAASEGPLDGPGLAILLASLLYVPSYRLPYEPLLQRAPWPARRLLLASMLQRVVVLRTAQDEASYCNLLSSAARTLLHWMGEAEDASDREYVWWLRWHLNSALIYTLPGSLHSLQEQRGRALERISELASGCKLDWIPLGDSQVKSKIGFLWKDAADRTENFTNILHLEAVDRKRHEVVSIVFDGATGKGEIRERLAAASDIVLTLPPRETAPLDARLEMVRCFNLDVCLVLSNVTFGWNEYICLAAHRLGRVHAVNYCSPITIGFHSVNRVVISEALAASSNLEAHYLEEPAVIEGSEICFPSWVREPVAASSRRSRSGADSNPGEIVFVSGASMFKISSSCRRAWVEILTRLPEAKLVLYPFNPNWGRVSPGALAFCRVLEEECLAAEVDPERISVEGPWSQQERIYDILGKSDIYLDSFPHSGGLSTIDAIRVGRPFVTLTGESQRERQGFTLARDLGCEHLIARSLEEYVDIACALARRPDLREDLSRRILQRLPSAEFGNEEGFKRRFGRLVDRMVADAREMHT